MADEHLTYADLPRLRGERESLRGSGRSADAAQIDEQIRRLTAEAQRAAAPVLKERDIARERFRRLVREIRELEGTVAEDPGSRESRDARIRTLAEQARRVKRHHDRLTSRIKEFRRYLTAVSRPTPGDAEPNE